MGEGEGFDEGRAYGQLRLLITIALVNGVDLEMRIETVAMLDRLLDFYRERHVMQHDLLVSYRKKIAELERELEVWRPARAVGPNVMELMEDG